MTYRNFKERTLGQKSAIRRMSGGCLSHTSIREQVELVNGIFVPRLKLETRGPTFDRRMFIEEEGVLKWKWSGKEPGSNIQLAGIRLRIEFFTWFFFTEEFPLHVVSLFGNEQERCFQHMQGFTHLGSQRECCHGDFSDKVLVFGTNGYAERPALFEGGPLVHFYEHGTWPRDVTYLDGDSSNLSAGNLQFHFGDGPPELAEPEEKPPAPRYHYAQELSKPRVDLRAAAEAKLTAFLDRKQVDRQTDRRRLPDVRT